jgi:hypothetical protein
MGVVGMQRLRDTEIEIESNQQHQRNTASSTRQPWKKGGPAALQQTSDEEAKRLNVDSD